MQWDWPDAEINLRFYFSQRIFVNAGISYTFWLCAKWNGFAKGPRKSLLFSGMVYSSIYVLLCQQHRKLFLCYDNFFGIYVFDKNYLMMITFVFVGNLIRYWVVIYALNSKVKKFCGLA